MNQWAFMKRKGRDIKRMRKDEDDEDDNFFPHPSIHSPFTFHSYTYFSTRSP
jgi:hypothetical protein